MIGGVDGQADDGQTAGAAAPLRFDPKYQCTAMSTQTGERCRAPAIKGCNVCRSHGGSAPQVREAGRRRLEREQLRARVARDRTVARLLDELEVDGSADPVEALEDALRRVAAMVTVLGMLVGDLGAPDPGADGGDGGAALWGRDHHGDGAPHVLVQMYRDHLDLYARVASVAVKLGIEVRRDQVIYEQGHMLAAVMQRTVVGLLAAARELLPGFDDEAGRALAARLPGLLRAAGDEVMAGAGTVGDDPAEAFAAPFVDARVVEGGDGRVGLPSPMSETRWF